MVSLITYAQTPFAEHHSLKQTPTLALLCGGNRPSRIPAFSLSDLAETLDLLEHLLQEVLAPHDIKVSADLGIFTSKALYICGREITA